jgi:hypothetical protein
MKILWLVALGMMGCLGVEGWAVAPKGEVETFLAEGRAAMAAGDLKKARGAFEVVREIDPKNMQARQYLQRIELSEKALGKVGDQRKELAGVIVPRVQLKGATLGEVFGYLKATVGKLSEGRVGVNFVLKIPEEVLRTKTITLEMVDAPFTEVLKYVAELGELDVQYQPYAVVVSARVAAPVVPGKPLP